MPVRVTYWIIPRYEIRSMPEISIILLSWNNGKFIGPCLDAVMAQTFKDYEVLAVDNKSSDDTVEIYSRYPVQVIQTGYNAGGCEGINHGIRKARGKYVFLLDIDTRMHPEALGRLYRHMEAHPELGAVQAKMIIRRTGKINSAGNAMSVLGHTWSVGLHEDDRGQYPSRPLTNLSGATFFVRRSVLDKVGIYDSEMFLYNEDADLSLRCLLYGFELGFVEDAVVEHEYTVSVNTKTKYFYLERNRWILLLKNFEFRTLAVFAPLLLFQEIGILAYAATHGMLVEKCKGYFWIMRQMGATLGKRRKIQAERVCPDKVILSRLERSFRYADMQNWAVKGVLNPVMKIYSSFALKLLGARI